MSSFESLIKHAENLPLNERIELIEALWETLPQGADDPLSNQWLAEINRRSEEFDNGDNYNPTTGWFSGIGVFDFSAGISYTI